VVSISSVFLLIRKKILKFEKMARVTRIVQHVQCWCVYFNWLGPSRARITTIWTMLMCILELVSVPKYVYVLQTQCCKRISVCELRVCKLVGPAQSSAIIMFDASLVSNKLIRTSYVYTLITNCELFPWKVRNEMVGQLNLNFFNLDFSISFQFNMHNADVYTSYNIESVFGEKRRE